MTVFHELKHIFKTHHRSVITWWEGGKLMKGLRCVECGKVEDIREATTKVEWQESDSSDTQA